MPKQPNPGKTQRILSIYHLLAHCQEVSMQELASLLPGSKKTFSRDIALLKGAGIPIRYSARRRAFILLDRGRSKPVYPESRTGRLYLDKIIRLTRMMDEIEAAPQPDEWYREAFPALSLRTMQRDFSTLGQIGYRIAYERSLVNAHNEGFDLPPGQYYCDFPTGTYALPTLNQGGFTDESM